MFRYKKRAYTLHFFVSDHVLKKLVSSDNILEASKTWFKIFQDFKFTALFAGTTSSFRWSNLSEKKYFDDAGKHNLN